MGVMALADGQDDDRDADKADQASEHATQNSIIGPVARVSCFFFVASMLRIWIRVPGACQLSALSGIVFSDVEYFVIGQRTVHVCLCLIRRLKMTGKKRFPSVLYVIR